MNGSSVPKRPDAILAAKMKRVAWFTPIPPVRSGVARYSMELLPRLSHSYAIDLFLESSESVVAPTQIGTDGVFSAHDYVWKHRLEPYDLTVFQVGNSPCHDYMWPYLLKYSGLVTLHDGQLHHSRARSLLQAGRADDYRAEFSYNHPTADPRLAELGVAGLMGALSYMWPMRRVILDSAQLILVHNTWLATELRSESSTPVEVVAMGVPALHCDPNTSERVKSRHGVSPRSLLLALFGKVTPEKRVSQVLHSLANLKCERNDKTAWHLILCGELVDHYDPRAEAATLGIGDRVTVTGYLPDQEMPNYISAADICLCLRWPSSRETSASWLRCLAAGKPTVVTDLVQLTDVPSLDPRNWSLAGYPAGRDSRGEEVHPACVTIDILDEDHSLTLALRRLLGDASLRAALGRAARQLWEERFTLERMVDGYDHAMRTAFTLTSDDTRRGHMPPHLLNDGTQQLRDLLDDLGIPFEL